MNTYYMAMWKIDKRWIWGIFKVNKHDSIMVGESHGFVTACRQARKAYLKAREGK